MGFQRPHQLSRGRAQAAVGQAPGRAPAPPTPSGGWPPTSRGRPPRDARALGTAEDFRHGLHGPASPLRSPQQRPQLHRAGQCQELLGHVHCCLQEAPHGLPGLVQPGPQGLLVSPHPISSLEAVSPVAQWSGAGGPAAGRLAEAGLLRPPLSASALAFPGWPASCGLLSPTPRRVWASARSQRTRVSLKLLRTPGCSAGADCGKQVSFMLQMRAWSRVGCRPRAAACWGSGLWGRWAWGASPAPPSCLHPRGQSAHSDSRSLTLTGPCG